jgi:hypothetical protein
MALISGTIAPGSTRDHEVNAAVALEATAGAALPTSKFAKTGNYGKGPLTRVICNGLQIPSSIERRGLQALRGPAVIGVS